MSNIWFLWILGGIGGALALRATYLFIYSTGAQLKKWILVVWEENSVAILLLSLALYPVLLAAAFVFAGAMRRQILDSAVVGLIACAFLSALADGGRLLLKLYRRKSGAVVVAILIIATLLLLPAIQLIPEWQAGRALNMEKRASSAQAKSAQSNDDSSLSPLKVADLQNEMRRTLLQIIGGIFALAALWYTARRVKVAEQSHENEVQVRITDSYTKAIEQLGAVKIVEGKSVPNIEVRLGAIYALERIAKDSPRDHWPIMEVLTAYVRYNSPVPKEAKELENPHLSDEEKSRLQTKLGEAIEKGVSTEVQAILTVLGRRKTGENREKKGQSLDLSRCALFNANFEYGYFESANFSFSQMHAASFRKSSLYAASFDEANIRSVDFSNADISHAHFFHTRGLQVEQFTQAGSIALAIFETKFENEMKKCFPLRYGLHYPFFIATPTTPAEQNNSDE